MRGHSFLEKATILAGLAGNVDAFWRMPCLSRSGLARIDPLVNPGTISAHAHSIHGSSGFGESADYDSLLAGECTSCQVSQDKSAYWTPSLYFKNAATGKFQLVQQVGGMLAYYLLYGDNVTAFPKDFHMIAGDNTRRNFSNYPVPDIDKSDWNKAPYNTQAFLRQAALGFNCLNYGAAAEGSLYRHFLPDKAYLDAHCADGVRFELMFPSCWNSTAGPNPEDAKSHMAYPSEVMTGTCPEGFDTRLVSLFFETIWATNAFIGVDGEFVISNGDPTGYGYHGDFMMGWEETFLQEAVSTCTNLSGKISDCPLFNIQDESIYGSCNFTMPAALESDDVVGPMAELPGNCPIQSGPQAATTMPAASGTGESSSTSTSPTSSTSAATTTSTSAVVPSLAYSAGSTIVASLGQTYAPGGVFAAVESGASYSASSSSTSVANIPSITSSASLSSATSDSCYSKTYSTTTIYEDHMEKIEVFEICWVEETITVGGVVRRRHLHEHQQKKRAGHGHGHGHFA
ncbi:hypothetical protein NHQ30_004128 [Ciborinia camelliae]|nr:hypothetical protein NHQ30_004128 [Ciborinia camelliae]